MRLAFISHEFPPDTGKGGIGTYVMQTAAAMASFGFDIHVFAGSTQRVGTVEQNGYKVHLISCVDAQDFGGKVLGSFEILHHQLPFLAIESAEINGNAWEIKKRYPLLPLVVRLHAPCYLVEGLKKKYVSVWAKLRFVAGSIRKLRPDLGYWRPYYKEEDPDYKFTILADYITAPSVAMKEWAIKNWALKTDRITVIPNIFAAPKVLLDAPLCAIGGTKTVVFFGRLSVLKGLVKASVAMLTILKKYPDWRFVVIGDDGEGPDAKTSMRLWMESRMEPVLEQVAFLPGLSYDKLMDTITTADIILLPSLFESFSYACAEAMAAGKAIVGSKNGGMAMLIEDAVSGLLVDPNDSSEIYKAVNWLICNDDERYGMGVQARKRITDEDFLKASVVFRTYYQTLLN